MTHQLLLIEDSPTQLITIRKRLESCGYSILTANTVAEGLVLAYDMQPDLIISDIVMSEINGYQLCRLVKSDPELAYIPVILLTKLDGSVDRFWGMKSGADRFIPKEPGFPTLLKATKEILENSSKGDKVESLPLSKSGKKPSAEEINSRLNQLLERLLFEATIIDEVRKLVDESLDVNSIVEKLFDLMPSVLNYEACALAVNEGTETNVFLDCGDTISEESIASFLKQSCSQLGLPPVNIEAEECAGLPVNALCQPIDIHGQRLGVLMVLPHNDAAFQPGDMKVVRIICEQLTFVLRLYLSIRQKDASRTN